MSSKSENLILLDSLSLKGVFFYLVHIHINFLFPSLGLLVYELNILISISMVRIACLLSLYKFQPKNNYQSIKLQFQVSLMQTVCVPAPRHHVTASEIIFILYSYICISKNIIKLHLVYSLKYIQILFIIIHSRPTCTCIMKLIMQAQAHFCWELISYVVHIVHKRNRYGWNIWVYDLFLILPILLISPFNFGQNKVQNHFKT